MKKITGNIFHFVAIRHADCGHHPDYGYAVYKYKPSWNEQKNAVERNNTKIFYEAFLEIFNTLVLLKEQNDKQFVSPEVEKKAREKLPEINEMLKVVVKDGFQTELWYKKTCMDFKILDLIKICSFDDTNKPINSTVCEVYKKGHDDATTKGNIKLAKFEAAARKHYIMVKDMLILKNLIKKSTLLI